MIEIREVKTKKDLKKFSKFPIDLYKGNPYFVPVMIADEVTNFSEDKNAAYEYAECKLWLAYREGKIVGRVGAILNKKFNEKENVKQIRFTRLDMIDDIEVTKVLLDKVMEYAKEKQMDEIIGPMGFSDLDKQGMLSYGFDELDMYITAYNHPYYVEHLEKLGWNVKKRWVEYQIAVPKENDERIQRVSDVVMKRGGYSIVKFNKKKDIKEHLLEAFGVMNVAYNHIYGYVELSQKQMLDFWNELSMIVDLDFLCVIKNKEDKVIGYGIMAASVSKPMQKGKGKLTLCSILSLIKTLKNPKVVDLFGIGVLPEYQKLGINSIILNECIKGLIKRGVKYAETGPELVTNTQVQSQWKDFEARNHKKRVLFSKEVK